jgi:hypothetical protein
LEGLITGGTLSVGIRVLIWGDNGPGNYQDNCSTIDAFVIKLQILYVLWISDNFRKSIPPSLGAILIGDMTIELNILENISGIKKSIFILMVD